MKKSEIFKKAQIAVAESNILTKEEKFEILEKFIFEEQISKILEEAEERKSEQEQGENADV